MLTLTSPVDTWLHGVRAGVKLGALCVFTAALFAVSDLRVMLGALAVVVALHAQGWVFARHAAGMLWPVWPFVVVVGVWHAATGDINAGVVIILRLLTAVAAANLVTMTTRLSDMIALVAWALGPFARILPAQRVAISIALVIRFIPVMGQKMALIRAAWAARSARRAGWRIMVPMLLATIDDADQVAEALRARGGAG